LPTQEITLKGELDVMFKKAVLSCLSYMIGFTVLISAAHGADVILNGAGATFPHPLYEKWIEVYRKTTGVRISYSAVGSGAGIQRLLQKEVDFGATDAFMSDEDLARAGEEILHVPTCLGAVAIIYHLPEKPILRFTPKLISDIFSGRISNWSHSGISAVNPGVQLPDLDISVVHRSEGSGTTFVFTDYLSKVDSEWRETIGCGKRVRWRTGMGVEGNPNVADFVQKIPGSIGYVELAYAKQRHLPAALVKNRSGQFIAPTLESVSRAAEVGLPSDTRILITDSGVRDGYPISAFTWLIFYKEQAYNQRPSDRASQLGRFLWWTIHEGQQYNADLLYAPLPAGAVSKGEAIISSIRFGGNH
jgi:phosphate transport system substrate-binding protein